MSLRAIKSVSQTFSSDSLDALLWECLTLTYDAIR